MKRLIVIIGVLILSIVFGGVSYAATATTNLEVSANVPATCSVSVSGTLDFGSYNRFEGNLGSNTVSIICSNGTSYTLYVPESRIMTSGANSLAYELYRDQTHLALFGNSQPTGWHRTGTGGQEDVTIYGWINTGLNPPVGNYTQTVTVTVEY